MRKTVAAIVVIVMLLALVFCVIWFNRAQAPTVQRAAANDAAANEAPRGSECRPRPEEMAPKGNTVKPELPAKTEPPEKTEKPPQPKVEPLKGLFVAGKVLVGGSDTPAARAFVLLVNDEDVLRARASEDGAFRIELAAGAALAEGAQLSAYDKEHGDGKAVAKLGDGTVIRLIKGAGKTIINVRIEGTGVPEKVWLRWEKGEATEQEGAEITPAKPVARIELSPKAIDRGACRACTQWYGKLLESEPVQIKWGEEQEIVLKPQDGATLRVVVRSIEGPLAGALVKVRAREAKELSVRTKEDGTATLTCIPAPVELSVGVEEARDGVICTESQSVSIGAVNDSREVTFDFSTCGIVDCRLTSGGEEASMLRLDGGGLSGETVWLWRWENGGDSDRYQHKIYGLKPGSYHVRTRIYVGGGSQEFSADFDVLSPPGISSWVRDFKPDGVTVRVRGASDTSQLRAWAWREHEYNPTQGIPDAMGVFLLDGIGEKPFTLLIAGGGYASKFLVLDPAKGREFDVDLERAGTVRFKARGTREEGYSTLDLKGIEPAVPLIHLDNNEVKAGLTLAPGRYGVSGGAMALAPWKPTEFTIVAGEEVACEYGPNFTAKLVVHVSDRSELWDFKVKILRNGEEVEFTYCQTSHGGTGDEYFQYCFEAEGKLKVIIAREGYETFEKDFEVKREEEASLEFTPKRKE